MKKIFSLVTAMSVITTICDAQANTALSNLKAPTKVNVSLLPGLTASKDLGSSTKLWRDGYFYRTVYGYGSGGGSYGVYGSGNIYGIYGSGPGTGIGVYGSGGTGLYGSGNTYGVYGSGNTYGVYGNAGTYGVWGNSSYIGVYGSGTTYGVYGFSNNHIGVEGYSNTDLGGYFYSSGSYGLRAATGRSDKNWAGVFDGNVFCFGAYQTSDQTLKKNINDFSNAMSIINQLKPKNYEFRDDGKYATFNLPKGTHYGLIAQDIEEVLPDLVKESDHALDPAAMANRINSSADASGANTASGAQNLAQSKQAIEMITVKAVNYTELIPIIIKALQELDQENTKLKNEVATLSQAVNQSIKTQGSVSLSSASLGQNFPNPFSKSTIISFNIPKESGAASIIITQTGSGKMIRNIPVSTTTSQLTFDASSLVAGNYTYTLYVDGKKVDTKQMVIGR